MLILDVQLEEFTELEENKVLETLNEVSLARKVAIMHLMDTKFGEKDEIIKRKNGVTESSKKTFKKNKIVK